MPRIFVAQTLVDRWLSESRIQLGGEWLRLSTGGGPAALFIDPAVFFEQVDGGEQAPYPGVGCVKSSQELLQMGAEHYDRAVVLGEQAYTVAPGFIAVPVGPDGTETLMGSSAWEVLRGALLEMSG